MKVLVVGGGGREHAICLALKKSKNVEEIWCAPGNGGISYDVNVKNIPVNDVDAMVEFAKSNNFDYAVVAQDEPLALGMVDALEEAGIPAFGPNAPAARIESSKVFSKDLMKKYGIPTATYEVFSDAQAAKDYVESYEKFPVVLKADGLALGKGVLICANKQEALDGIDEIMVDKKFGDSGNNIVVEEFLTGPEVSVLSFCDGKTCVPMVSSMDHKRALDGDEGLNTGGMGVIAPNPYYTAEIAEVCRKIIFEPTMAAMIEEGYPFKGCLYFGLMITEDGPKVIEYNARFGDPEAQVVLPLLQGDFLEICQACTNGNLADVEFSFSNKASAIVIMASGGYPLAYEKGIEIGGLRNGQIENCEHDNVHVIHAGDKIVDGKLVTNGGRVLGVVAVSDTLEEALDDAYDEINNIKFLKSFYRHDIGKRALEAGR